MADSPFLPDDPSLATVGDMGDVATAAPPDFRQKRLDAALAAALSLAMFAPVGKIMGMAGSPWKKALLGAGIGGGLGVAGSLEAEAQKAAQKGKAAKEGQPVQVTPTAQQYTPFEIKPDDPQAKLKGTLNEMFNAHADLTRQSQEEEKKQVGPSGGRGPNWRGLQERITGLEGDIRAHRKLLAQAEREDKQPSVWASWGPSAAGVALGSLAGFGAAGPAVRRSLSRYTDFNSVGQKLEQNLAQAAQARAPLAGRPLGNEMTANVNVASKLGYAKEPFNLQAPHVKPDAGTMPGPFARGQPWVSGSGSRLEDAAKNPANWLSAGLFGEGAATNWYGGGFDSTRRPEDNSTTDLVLQAIGRGSMVGGGAAKLGGWMRKGINMPAMKPDATALMAEKAARMRMINEYGRAAGNAAPAAGGGFQHPPVLGQQIAAAVAPTARPGYLLPTGAQGDLAEAAAAKAAKRSFLERVHQDERITKVLSALQANTTKPGGLGMSVTPGRLHLALSREFPEGIDGIKVTRKLAAEILTRRPQVPGANPFAPPVQELMDKVAKRTPAAAPAAGANGDLANRARRLLNDGHPPSEVARILKMSERDLYKMFPDGL